MILVVCDKIGSIGKHVGEIKDWEGSVYSSSTLLFSFSVHIVHITASVLSTMTFESIET